MSLRGTSAVLGTFIRAGVFCLAPGARTCVAHGLPETPDFVTFTPTAFAATASCGYGWYLESFDATSLVFNNSFAGASGMLKAEVIYRQIQ